MRIIIPKILRFTLLDSCMQTLYKSEHFNPLTTMAGCRVTDLYAGLLLPFLVDYFCKTIADVLSSNICKKRRPVFAQVQISRSNPSETQLCPQYIYIFKQKRQKKLCRTRPELCRSTQLRRDHLPYHCLMIQCWRNANQDSR
jgi:hypothetical protein